MKIKTNPTKKRLLYSIALGIALLTLGVAGYATYSSNQLTTVSEPSTDVDESQAKPSADQPTSVLPFKKNEEQKNNNVDSPYKPSSVDEPAPPIEVPRIERASQSGDTVKIVASLQGNSSGTCEAKLQQGATVLKRNSPVVIGTSYYTCSFTIATSQFAKSGTWDLTLSHLQEESVSTAPLQTVEVQK